jgi:sigma-B regulation protein RsbU (phosphoserine phosphatase)
MGILYADNLESADAFSATDFRTFTTIAAQAGLALFTAITRGELAERDMQAQIVAASLELARDIQMGLVPKDFPALPEFKEVEIFATMVPALEVGGDLYDFFPLDKDRICFIIGDVSGKGIPAALFMAIARTAFKISAIALPESIALTMSRVNEFLCDSNPQQMFVTAFAGILDLRTGRVDYADAGHEPPFILQADGTVRAVSKVGGIALGFVPDHKFRGGTLQLNPGDALLLYTDGVTEAMNTNRELLGAEAIETSLSRAGRGAGSEKIIRAVLEDLRAFVGGAHQSDDVTMLAIRYFGRDRSQA